jgi:putative peptidoglycan lipid II flippase
MSTARSLFKVNLIVGLTLIIGFINNIIISNMFGLSHLLDAYFAALVLPSLFMILFVDYMGKNFLPVFSELRLQSYERASAVTSSVINIVVIVAIIISGFLVLFSRAIFNVLLPGFSAEIIDHVTVMFTIMAPAIVFMAVNTFHEYILQYHEHYPQVVQYRITVPLMNLVAMLMLGGILREYSLAVGFMAGQFLNFILLVSSVDYKYRLSIDFKNNYLRRIFVNSGILMIGGVLARSQDIILKYFSSTLDTGTIAAMSLAAKLCTPLEQSALVGIRMIAFSRSSKLYVDDQLAELGKFCELIVATILLFLIPVSVWVGLNSVKIIDVLFTRGAFTESNKMMVALALAGLIPSVVFSGVTQVISSTFYVMNRISVPAVIMPTGTLIYIPLLSLLSYHFGIFGLAAAMSITTLIILITISTMLGRTLLRFSNSRMMGKLTFYTLISVLFYGSSIKAAAYLSDNPFIELIISSFGGSLLYAGLLWGIADREFVYAKDKVLQTLRKSRPSS